MPFLDGQYFCSCSYSCACLKLHSLYTCMVCILDFLFHMLTSFFVLLLKISILEFNTPSLTDCSWQVVFLWVFCFVPSPYIEIWYCGGVWLLMYPKFNTMLLLCSVTLVCDGNDGGTSLYYLYTYIYILSGLVVWWSARSSCNAWFTCNVFCLLTTCRNPFKLSFRPGLSPLWMNNTDLFNPSCRKERKTMQT